MNSHIPGDSMSLYGIPLTLHKVAALDKFGSSLLDSGGKPVMKCGFRIGGGVDQNPLQCPHGYPDKGIYITYIEERSAAANAGLQAHDKILQVNGMDFTMVTHDKACKMIKKYPVLQLIVYRKGVPTPTPNPLYDSVKPAHQQIMHYPGYAQTSGCHMSAPNNSFASPQTKYWNDKY